MPHTDPRAPSERRGGWLGAVGALSLANPARTLTVGALLLAVCAVLSWNLPISTSRYKLVANEHPFQARMMRFFDRFGYPDSMVLVLSGGSVEQRRRAVDALGKRLDQEPDLHGRVLGRVQIEQMAELMFLLKPEVMAELKAGYSGEIADLVEGGLPAWVGALNDRLGDELEADDDQDAPRDAAQADEGLRHLAALLRALDLELAGGDGLRELPQLGASTRVPKGVVVDAQGYVVSQDGKRHLIALFPELPGAEGSEVRPVVERIRAIRDSVPLGGVTARLTGLPALVTDELAIVKRGLLETSGVTTLAILGLLYGAFRSLRYTILALLPLAVGLVLTLTAARLMFGGLNLITSSFVSVLLALGIDFGVYLLSRYGEQVRAGDAPRSAIIGAVVKAGPGMLIGAATTIMAFLMTTTTEFTAYSELGTLTAVGLGLMVAVTFMFLPPLIIVAGRGKQIHAPELRGVAHIVPLVRRGRHVIVVLAVLLVALGATSWSRLRFNLRYFDFLPDSMESARALRRIQDDPTLSPVQAGAGTDSIPAARALTAKLRALPSVGAVQSATDALPELTAKRLAALRSAFTHLGREPDFDKLRHRSRSNAELAAKLRELGDTLDEVGFAERQAGRSTKALDLTRRAASALRHRIEDLKDHGAETGRIESRFASILERAWRTAEHVAARGHYLPADLPSMFRARFASKDGQTLAVYANPAGNIWDAKEAKRFATEVESVAPDVAGMAVNIHHHMRMIREGFTRASIWSAALVLVLLLIGFRRLDDALFAMLPVALGTAALFGVMGTFGIDFDVVNVVVPPLILGIGIDSGAHMIHRWRQSADAHGGVAQLDEVVRGTGAAVLLASLTTIAGFASLMLGQYGAMKSLGLTMTVGVSACLLASLLVLPALLVALGKAR